MTIYMCILYMCYTCAHCSLKIAHTMPYILYLNHETVCKCIYISTWLWFILYRIGSAIVQILKGVTLALCLSLLIMLLLITIVMCYDKLEVCGPNCRHSPMATLYSMFNPYWQYRSVYTPV